MTVDKEWGWGPTNNYCKWFHVCEHESNHNGQIKFLKTRLPGARAGERVMSPRSLAITLAATFASPQICVGLRSHPARSMLFFLR